MNVGKTKNSPFVTNKEKEFQYKKTDYPVQKTELPAFELKMYNTNPPPPPRNYNTAPAYNYGGNVKIPVNKIYNINLPGPTGGHVAMNKIYENILPFDDTRFSYLSIGERLVLYDYIKQVLINSHEGENISLDATGHRSILSYIKFMELNPNYYNPLYNNPYKGLPYGLLIYRSCFPIKLEPISHTVSCAKESIGMNIRIYTLNLAEYYSYYFRQPLYKEYDVWREISYYEYVNENIIKKKQCPNFVIFYTFFISLNAHVDYFRLKKNTLSQKETLTKDYQKFLERYQARSHPPASNMKIRPLTACDSCGYGNINKLPDEIDRQLQKYSGNVLIGITEAPTYNFYTWASKTYEGDGIVKKMITTGMHSEEEWYNIFFQITHALYALQVHGIYIRDMTIEDNVNIKEVPVFGRTSGYWKITINDIPYYLPNAGNLVMIDTNFKDIIKDSKTLDSKREYKIYTSDIFGKQFPMTEIQEKVYENYKNIVNSNIFTPEHTKNNVMKPPEKILNFLSSLEKNKDKNIGNIFLNYFQMFLHNRIGHLLKNDSEVPKMISSGSRNFAKGDMIPIDVEAGKYKWGLVTKVNGNVVTVLTRATPDGEIISEDHTDPPHQYPRTEKVEQDYKNEYEKNFPENQLLESYVLNEKSYPF